jgi:uncharacterized protein DUF4349
MITNRPHLRFRLRRTASAAAAVAALVLLSGCSSSGDSDSGSAGSSSSDEGGGSAREVASAPEPAQADADSAGGVRDAADSSASGSGSGSAPGPEAQKVISTGTVQLRSDDVPQAIFDVRKVVDAHRGTVAEDDTETDEDGQALRSRMVLRVPTADFDDAMSELEGVATLAASQRESADVTTEVLDVDVRVQAQQRSIDRIQVLFDNATSIKDIVDVEGELSRRQADLASLEAQQRYLADQTSLSTITVAVDRTPEHVKPKPEPKDHTGFIAGLGGGWDALKAFLVGVATVSGALLPWLVLALVLVIPGWPLYRRLRRRQTAAA